MTNKFIHDVILKSQLKAISSGWTANTKTLFMNEVNDKYKVSNREQKKPRRCFFSLEIYLLPRRIHYPYTAWEKWLCQSRFLGWDFYFIIPLELLCLIITSDTFVWKMLVALSLVGDMIGVDFCENHLLTLPPFSFLYSFRK